MSDIFISYKREDRNRAKPLAETLEKTGWSVWWDPQLRSGEHFDDVIERELKSAKCVIVLWSDQSVSSQYVRDEAAYALKLNKLIPVAIDEVELPFRYQGLHTARLVGWKGSPTFPAFKKLLDDIATRIEPRPEKSMPRRTATKVKRSPSAKWKSDSAGVLIKQVKPSLSEEWAECNEPFLREAFQKFMQESLDGFGSASAGKQRIDFVQEVKGPARSLLLVVPTDSSNEFQFTKAALDSLVSLGFKKSNYGKYEGRFQISDDELSRAAQAAAGVFTEIYQVSKRAPLKIELVL